MIWRLTYCNKKGVEARIDIIKGDTTSIEIVEGSANPFTISYRLDKNDKSGHIMTSSADIEIFETATFNIDDLKTSNETELKVEYFEDNILTWSGFILPDFFSREIGSPNIVRMTASDRLTALKGITLSDLPARISLRSLIELCLSKTGLSLGLVAQIQINQGSTNILDSEILSQRLTDVRGRSISCYDILMSIMVATNSTIRQRAGQWQVYNKLEHELRTPTISFDKVERGAIRTIQPVASSVGVYQEFGGGRIHPENYDFSDNLAGWNPVGGFNGSIDNREILGYNQTYNIIYGEETDKSYLVNSNNFTTSRYIETDAFAVPYEEGKITVKAEINAIGPRVQSGLGAAKIRFAIIAEKNGTLLSLNDSGAFVAGVHIQEREFSTGSPLDLIAVTMNIEASGVLMSPAGYSVRLRFYGSNVGVDGNVTRVTAIDSAIVSFEPEASTPKGNLYKTTQGSNYTKLHDVETVIFGDYITSGLNGYFYNYPIDDTSNLYLPDGELSSPTWITLFDTTERPLLHHISRQKSRLFSVAHDILRANINVESFDPLAVFQDCKGGKYVVVSARFDFLRSEVDVELEQIAEDRDILKRDFIYSYFGEGEDTIKSIGGIAGGGEGGGINTGIIGGINEKIDEVGQKVDDIKVGVSNLLRNTGFLGDFKPMDVDALTAVLENTPVGTNPLVHWVHDNVEIIDMPSRSGKGAKIGSLQQNVNLRAGEAYVLSFMAKGTSLTVDLVDSIEVELTDEFKKYSFDIVSPNNGSFIFLITDPSSSSDVYEIMLSEGNTDVDYAYAAEDDLKAISQLQAINAITSVIKDMDTETLGGLILTSMIQLGKYKDGVMEKVNAGINGIYNNDDDPAVWAGGSFEDAIRTVQRIKENPYSISEDEWSDLANIVMTHGGDGIFRGIIYALGGLFRGRVESNSSGNRIIIDPDDRSIKGLGANGKVRFSLSFTEEAEEWGVETLLRMYTYNAEGERLMRVLLNPTQITFESFTNPAVQASFGLSGVSVLMYEEVGSVLDVKMDFDVSWNSIAGAMDVKMEGLRTSASGLPPGHLYKDEGFLKIT